MRVYSTGDFLDTLKDVDFIIKAKNLPQVAKHDMLSELLANMPLPMFTTGAHKTREHTINAINEALALVGYTAPVVAGYTDLAPNSDAGASTQV